MKKRNQSGKYRIEDRPTAAQLRTMLALSLRQPWADWVVRGEKVAESRTWRIRTPQTILVHATTLLPKYELAELAEDLGGAEFWMNEFRQLPIRGVVGKVTVTECVWDSGMFTWRLSDPVLYRRIYHCPGGLKLFRVKVR